MVGYAFAAQYRDRVTQLRPDRRAAAGRGPVGGDPQEPAALALPLRRAGHGAPGRRARAHLPRSLLERVLRRSQAVSPRRRASTMPSSMHSLARCTPASRSSRPSTRTPSTTGRSSRRASRRCRCWRWAAKNLRPDDGRGDALRCEQRGRRASFPTPAIGSWRRTRRRPSRSSALSSTRLNSSA